jgi:type IV secretion system protein VirB9
MINKLYLTLLITFALLTNASFATDFPITTDRRIQTYVYSENEVFKLVIHYGYQTSIEFAIGEQVKTISMGDNFAWKITPSGNRLFVKPLQENVHTNMTIITNMRTYHFDLFSKAATDLDDNELVYVLRFFYPTPPASTANQ